MMLRAAVVAVSVVVCAWFALGVRQAIDTDKATTILSAGAHITRHEATRASSLLHGAGLLNPNRQVDVLRAEVALERGDKRRAVSILQPVVAAEPMNLTAWQLFQASAITPAERENAYVALGTLVPPLPRSGH